MGLDWPTSLELIRKSVAQAKTGGHLIALGGGRHRSPRAGPGGDDRRRDRAYEEAMRGGGGGWKPGDPDGVPRPCARPRAAPMNYARVYRAGARRAVRSPAILHWLGEMFDPPALEG